MNSEKLNDWLQLVGLFGIMASLFFVRMQMRQTQAKQAERCGRGHNFHSFSPAESDGLAAWKDVFLPTFHA